MTYVLLSEASRNLKGGVIVKVTEIGELKAGTGKNGDWTKKDATVEDASGEQKLTLWNGDIQKIELGKHYFLENPFWTTYEGKPQLSLGKFCIVAEAKESDMLPGDGSTTKTAESSPQKTAQKTLPEVSEDELTAFAEKCVKSFVKACKDSEINPAEVAQGVSAVYNTAMMQKMKVR